MVSLYTSNKPGTGCIVAMALWAAACSDRVSPPQRCASTSECPGGWVCDGSGQCVVAQPCISDLDCCPGSSCLGGKCILPEFPCGPTNPCDGLDETCSLGVCMASPCLKDTDCHADHRCAAGVCSRTPPCGGCSPNEACVPAVQRCLPSTGPCSDVQCKPGEVRVVVNTSALLGLQCHNTAIECGCAALPEVLPPTPGFWGKGTLIDDLLTVVSYDPTYGDLVLQHFETTGPLAQSSTPVHTLWLDGVPSGPIEGLATGPRGGVVAAGPDVGKYLAMATDGDTLYATYRAEYEEPTAATLRFATILPEKQVILPFDLVTTANPGLHNAVVVRKDGHPAVATLIHETKEQSHTELKVLFASGPNPTGPESFPYSVSLDRRVKELGSPTALQQMVRGTGLFPAMGALPDGSIAVAWYDSIQGALWLAQVSERGVLTKVVLDGAPGASATGALPQHDTGRHNSMVVSSDGTLVLAYQDFSDHTLRVYLGPVDGTGVITTADDGFGHWVGGGIMTTLVDGKPWIAHGDETTGDLRMTRALTAGFSSTSIQVDGVLGHFPLVIHHQNVVFAGSLQLAVTANGTPIPAVRFVPIALGD